jgi:hypothetical protein
MIQLSVIPRARADLFRLLVDKELDLRRRQRGTLHRSGPRKRGREKWTHASYPGWITFERGADGGLAANVHSRGADGDWQLLRSLIGFLDRHFRTRIASVTISYDHSGQ